MKEILHVTSKIYIGRMKEWLKREIQLFGQLMILMWVLVSGYIGDYLVIIPGTVLLLIAVKYLETVGKYVNQKYDGAFPLPGKKFVEEQDGILQADKKDMQDMLLYLMAVQAYLEEKGYIYEKPIDNSEET